jgi:CDP-paratose 2-epimerase
MMATEAYGVAERFRPGDYARADRVVADLERLGVRRMRTALLPQDLASAHGRAWVEWLLAALAGKAELLVCLACSHATDAHRDAENYIGFVDDVLGNYSPYISAVELTASPRPGERDPRLDPASGPHSEAFAQVIERIQDRGKRVVLAGTPPHHIGWLELFGARGLLRDVDAISLQGYPAPGDLGGHFWPRHIDRLRALLIRHGSPAELWLTEAGYAGPEHDEHGRLSAFIEALDAPAQRVYWTCTRGTETAAADAAALRPGERAGLLGRMLANGGPAAVRELAAAAAKGLRRNGRSVNVITGGAGFIGTNLAARLLGEGKRVRIVDNLARAGTETNLKWLLDRFGDQVEFLLADMRDADTLAEATSDAEAVFHFAAQVAVTTSLTAPLHDLEVNGRGTLNLLEALRMHPTPPPLLFTSTNKVYGGLEGIDFQLQGCRYAPTDPELTRTGVGESRPLSFCSPYGCSKGAADQYVLDYARTFGLRTVVLRMSCIYGPHQFGNEDQGWVAHFVRQAASGEPINIYGDGRQVRDVLFVDDLLDAMRAAVTHIDTVSGQAFNIGGGPENTLSLLELVDLLTDMTGRAPVLHFEDWRASDQRWYVSDSSRFAAATGWRPRVGVNEGLARLWRWVSDATRTSTQRAACTAVTQGRLVP